MLIIGISVLFAVGISAFVFIALDENTALGSGTKNLFALGTFALIVIGGILGAVMNVKQ